MKYIIAVYNTKTIIFADANKTIKRVYSTNRQKHHKTYNLHAHKHMHNTID